MIPEELRNFKQWCCSSGESKIPLNAKTKTAAAVNDPNTWCTYEEAVAAGFPFVGFVLSEQDPYTIIDLDHPETEEQQLRHTKILEALDSYAELSKSGNGVHIIVKGTIPKGVRRDKVEIYSTLRYMICTGKKINDKPIVERQEMLDVLFREMDTTATVELAEEDQLMGDAELVDMAMAASNGDKFNQLCCGQWQQDYPSQSEADFALLSIIAYYTRSNEQVRRIFRMSALGKRAKAYRPDYLNTALTKIRAQQPPSVDFTQLLVAPLPPEEAPPVPETTPSVPESTLEYPGGLIGEVAQYIFSSSVRPVHEVSITAALGMIAGIAGRAYNISGTGLNQYIILLARTGSGKEGMSGGIDRLFKASRETIPVVDQFVGPGVFASGQALIKILETKPCFMSVQNEFGLTLQMICDPRANSANKMLKRVLLDLYTKSGQGDILQPMVYSDKDKNTLPVHAPAITIIGESTPEAFFNGLGQQHISEGLIPRFSIIEYNGDRPPLNDARFMPPNPGLVKKINDLLLTVLSLHQNNQVIHIKLSADAKKLLNEFNEHADKHMNMASKEVELQLWNRAHLKALKMAGLLAVGHSIHDPVVSAADAQWAIRFVSEDVKAITKKFENEEIGVGDGRLESEIIKAIKRYPGLKKKQRLNSYKVPKTIAGYNGFIPYCYLRRVCRRLAVFRNDRRGAIGALKIVLEDMVTSGVLDKLSPQYLQNKFNLRASVYIRGDSF